VQASRQEAGGREGAGKVMAGRTGRLLLVTVLIRAVPQLTGFYRRQPSSACHVEYVGEQQSVTCGRAMQALVRALAGLKLAGACAHIAVPLH